MFEPVFINAETHIEYVRDGWGVMKARNSGRVLFGFVGNVRMVCWAKGGLTGVTK